MNYLPAAVQHTIKGGTDILSQRQQTNAKTIMRVAVAVSIYVAGSYFGPAGYLLAGTFSLPASTAMIGAWCVYHGVLGVISAVGHQAIGQIALGLITGFVGYKLLDKYQSIGVIFGFKGWLE